MQRISSALRVFSLIGLLVAAGGTLGLVSPSRANSSEPPGQVVKLIFIHHSSGENWLADDNGGLGIALGENNYFVSDTNYGWGPDAIGDTTDIPDWLKWFRSADTDRIMQAVYTESGQNSDYTRTLPDPGGENQVVMFKSCFPNSNLEGNPDDAPTPGEGLTVSNAKYVYNEILKYFASRPDKLFIIITAPPVQDSSYAGNARAFNNWLVNDWLSENDYPYDNVGVFDFYNVLTGSTHHHRFVDGTIEHVYEAGHDTAAYPTEDDHPSAKGNRKATEEFVPLLNVYYHRWAEGQSLQPAAATSAPAVAAPEQAGETPAEESRVSWLPCLGSILLPITAFALFRSKTRNTP